MKITWFPNSPSIGDPDCICSWCGQLITLDQSPAVKLRKLVNKLEARFHIKPIAPCFEEALPLLREPVWAGLIGGEGQ